MVRELQDCEYKIKKLEKRTEKDKKYRNELEEKIMQKDEKL